MLEVVPIKAFKDNYLWLFKAEGSNQACIVDPGDAMPVLDYLEERNLQLATIFVTHHHEDHTGGIATLLNKFKVPVYGPKSGKISAITHELSEGDSVEIFNQVFNILEIPGHTLDHIAYFTTDNASANGPVLFCGDTLFVGGCGRVFEGTHEMMHGSLQKIAALCPHDSGILCP